MIRSRYYLAGVLLFIAVIAFRLPASAVTQDITLTATVPGICTISGSASPSAVTQNLSIDATGRVVTTTATLTFPFVCNKAATLALTAVNGGLTGPQAVTGYENKINYTATTSGVFPAVVLNTALPAAPLPGGGNPYASDSSGPATGTLTVNIVPAANANPLVSGPYSETLRLTITPAQ